MQTQPHAPATADPTAVVGRRILATIIDWIPVPIILGGFYAAGTTQADVGSTLRAQVLCDAINESDSSDFCVRFGETVLVTDFGDVTRGLLALAAYSFFFLGLLPGVSGGWSFGKLVTGLRVVKQETFEPVGIGASLLRWLLWVVDSAPYCLPLVGFITALASSGHRRVGDMAASTLVVGKDSVGMPVPVRGLAGAAAAPPPPGAAWPSGPPPPPGASSPLPSAPATSAAPSPTTTGPPSPGAATTPPAMQPQGGTTPPTFQPPSESSPPAFPPPTGAPASFPARGAPSDVQAFRSPPPDAAPEPESEPPKEPGADRDPGFVPPGSERTARMPTVGDDAPTTSLPVTGDGPDTGLGADAAPEPAAGTTESAAGADVAPAPNPEHEPGPAPEVEVGPRSELLPEPESPPALDPTTPQPGVDAPQWDAARNTYIQWDPELEQWMEWHEPGARWIPISS